MGGGKRVDDSLAKSPRGFAWRAPIKALRPGCGKTTTPVKSVSYVSSFEGIRNQSWHKYAISAARGRNLETTSVTLTT